MPNLFGTILQPRTAESCQVLRNSTVHVGDDGRIGQIASGRAKGEVVGDEDCWIVPGFIDAHLHMPQWDVRGIDGLTLFQWQAKIGFPAEARLDDPAEAEALAEQFTAGMIRHGTTTISAFGSPFAAEVDATFGVFARRGLRAIYGMMLNDVGVPSELLQSPDKALDESRTLAAKWHGAEGGRLRYAFSPRASIRCSERMMRGAGALAEMLKCHLQTHVAESPDEAAALREHYPDQVDEVDVLFEMGMLTERTILAHGMFASRQQRRQIADRRTAIAYCPTGSLFREAGMLDYVSHRAAGIRIALGSSIAGGPDPFMPRVAVEAMQMAKALALETLPRRPDRLLNPVEAWHLLTKGAAEALGLENVGTIDANYFADCLVVRPEPWIAKLPPSQQVSALLYTLTPQQIEHVYVAGKRIGPN